MGKFAAPEYRAQWLYALSARARKNPLPDARPRAAAQTAQARHCRSALTVHSRRRASARVRRLSSLHGRARHPGTGFKRLKPVLHIRELFSPLRLWRIRRLLCLHTGLKVGECAFDGLLTLGKPHMRTAEFPVQ